MLAEQRINSNGSQGGASRGIAPELASPNRLGPHRPRQFLAMRASECALKKMPSAKAAQSVDPSGHND